MPPKTKPAPRPAVAYSYQRFSSPAQAEGDSIRRQTELRDAWLGRSGAVLDTSVTLRDEGKSAFTGAHRENPDRHALAAFLRLVEQGRVPRGSYLIVESLDRLSREHIQPALMLFLSLLQSGVRIVQLIPVEQVFDQKSDAMQIMMAVMELSRGHSESAVKSQRLSAAWGEKRKRAAESKAVMSRACPAWITVRNGKYALIPEKAEVVRRIFRMAASGHGARAITKALAKDVDPISTRVRKRTGEPSGWNVSYVKLILTTRAAFGEYQPRAKGRPEGPPIAGYYPAAVTEREYHAVQALLTSRRKRDEQGKWRGVGGRPAKDGANVFSGLLFDARDGGPIHMHTHRWAIGRVYRSLTPYHSDHAGDSVSFPLHVFEAAVFKELREIDPRDILPDRGGAGDAVLALTGKLADIDARLAKVKTRMRGEDDLDTLIDLARELEGERKRVADELSAAEREAASPLSAAWGECQTLAGTLEAAPDREAARVRLRAALRRVVDSVWCLFRPGRGPRVAAVQFWFKGGHHRDYLILYRPEHVSHDSRRQAWWGVKSFAEAAVKGGLDLRDPKQAAVLAAELKAVDLTKVMGSTPRTTSPRRAKGP